MLKYVAKTWREITQDATGHTVALDLFKAISFGCGIAYFMLYSPLALLLAGVQLPADAGYWLTGSGFGFQALKIGAKYLNRLTSDTNGSPLATPGSVEPPATEPELMPK